MELNLLFAYAKAIVDGDESKFGGDEGTRHKGDLLFKEEPSSIYGRGSKTRNDSLARLRGIPRNNSKSEQTYALISSIITNLSAKKCSRAKHVSSNFIIRKHTNVLFVIRNIKCMMCRDYVCDI